MHNSDKLLNIIIASISKARFDYRILTTWEAGISLDATEVKSMILQGTAHTRASYVVIDRGEVFVVNIYIPRYMHAGRYNHEPTRRRTRLLHKREINKMMKVHDKFHTLIPTEVYRSHNKSITYL